MSYNVEEHLSFEECVDVVHAKRVDETFIRKISKVNHHIQHCEECRRMYSTILKAKEAAEELALQRLTQQEEENRVYRAIKAFAVKYQLAAEKIQTLLEKAKDFVVYMNFSLPTLSEIGLLDNQSDYWHPKLAMVTKSLGKDMVGEEFRSVLVNSNANRISVEEDGVLTLVLSSQECDEDSVVLLVPHDETKEIVMALPRPLDDDLFRISFEDVEPGDYYIKISS